MQALLRAVRSQRTQDDIEHINQLAQVRVHELNGELRPRQIPFPLGPPRPPHDPKWDAYLMLKAVAADDLLTQTADFRCPGLKRVESLR